MSFTSAFYHVCKLPRRRHPEISCNFKIRLNDVRHRQRTVSEIELKTFDNYPLLSSTSGKIPRHEGVGQNYEVYNLSSVDSSSFGKSIRSEVKTRKRPNVTCGDYFSTKEKEGFRAM